MPCSTESSSSPGQQKWVEKQAEFLIPYILQLKGVRNYLSSTKFHKPFMQTWTVGLVAVARREQKALRKP